MSSPAARPQRPQNPNPRRVCLYFSRPQGCNKGDACDFLHEAPRHTQRRRGEGGQQPNENYRTRPCKFFSTPEGCRNGKSCNFIHDTGVAAAAPAASLYRTKQCKYFGTEAGCRNGDSCTFKHDPVDAEAGVADTNAVEDTHADI
jgi:hypothetical protein